ncbi:cytochrome p450 [Trichoderma cornu-damae]|uniref:Cytochrome p450 n=1 Tax=Trichoderma cornu-damae TaxID=654480 RepID=A0A9P8TR99_9HYPO|nr:cytochrome p450 [Trichoderma cornu-damae]
MLKSTSEHPALQGVRESMFFIGVIGTVPWLLYMVGKIPGMTSYNRFYIWCNQQLKAKRTLQEAVQEQIPGGIADWTYEKAKAIRYLDYVIQETLRLRPSVPAGLPREVPRQGLTIDGEFIPGGAIVAVPTYTLQRDARRWSEPLSFKPERWESLSTEKAPWIAFSRGQYVCPGRHLAMMGLRMVLSRIALQYDIAFPLGHNGERFEKDTKDTFTLTLPELVLVFTPR